MTKLPEYDKIAEAPALFSLTRKQYDLGQEMGVIHG